MTVLGRLNFRGPAFFASVIFFAEPKFAGAAAVFDQEHFRCYSGDAFLLVFGKTGFRHRYSFPNFDRKLGCVCAELELRGVGPESYRYPYCWNYNLKEARVSLHLYLYSA